MLNKIRAKNSYSGFTLLEIIVAIFVLSIGVIGIINVIPQLLSNISIDSSRLAAAYLAQEGIEIIRNIRDTNWLEQRTNPGLFWDDGLNTSVCNSSCEADYTVTTQLSPLLTSYGTGRYLNIDANGFYSYSAGTQTKFKRKITVTSEGSDILKISVDIFWEEKGKSYQFPVQEKLYKWH